VLISGIVSGFFAEEGKADNKKWVQLTNALVKHD
jgi:hypothetical protein